VEPIKVLIVDDHPALRHGLVQLIGKEADLEVCGEAGNRLETVREAAEVFAREAYDVAVLDYHLPDGTGDTLLERFRAVRPECVCLMMTTDPGPKLALDWMKRGAAVYLQKPFDPSYLLELCAGARRERSLLRAQDLLELRTRELRESEEKYRCIFENSVVGFYRSTLDGRFLDANPALATMLRYDSPEDLVSSVSDIAN
jgi:DNA-binding NarL/FixJ family response regulator